MSEIYWITRLDYIEGVAIAIIVIAGLFTVGALFAICDGEEDTFKRLSYF